MKGSVGRTLKTHNFLALPVKCGLHKEGTQSKAKSVIGVRDAGLPPRCAGLEGERAGPLQRWLSPPVWGSLSVSGASPSQLRISEPWVWGAIYPSDSREDEKQYCKACQPQQWNLRRHIYAGHSVLSTLLLLVSQKPPGVQMFPTQLYISVLHPVSPTYKKRGSHQLPPSPYLHILSITRF